MPRAIFYLLLTCAALALAGSTALAQQIQGQVRFMDSGQAALGVLVRCNGTGGTSEQFTDRSGKFYFRVSPGHYNVTIHHPGYKDETQSVDLTDNMSNEYMFFRLKPEASARKSGALSTVDANVPPEAQKEFDKGEALIETEKKESMEEGVRHLEKAVSIYPNFLQAQLKLGTAYMDLSQWDKAEQALKRTLVIDPNAANAMFALGELYLRQKKDDEAEKILLEGLKLEDRSFQGHLTLARVYWDEAAKIKDATQSRPLLEKSYNAVNEALKLNPNLADAHLLKGDLLFKVRRAADAQHEFEEYLRLDPKGPFADQTRALVEKIKKALEQDKKP